jgi:hypothetical protein
VSWLLPLGATASAMSGALNDIRIRFATIDDAGLLLRLIRDLDGVGVPQLAQERSAD